jgi:hypothetical protein
VSAHPKQTVDEAAPTPLRCGRFPVGVTLVSYHRRSRFTPEGIEGAKRVLKVHGEPLIVAIEKGEYLSGRFTHPPITGSSRSPIWGGDDTDSGIGDLSCSSGASIGRSVVDDYDLEVGKPLRHD